MRVLLLAFAVAACGGKKDDKPTDSPANPVVGKPAAPPVDAGVAAVAKVEFGPALTEGTIVKCRSSCTTERLFADDAGKLPLKVTGPAGTKVQLHGTEITLGAQPTDLTLDALYLGLAWGEYAQIAVRVVKPGGTEEKLKLDLDAMPVVEKHFLKVKTGPIKFPREVKAKYEADMMVRFTDNGAMFATVNGDPDGNGSLYNVDFIEFSTDTKRKESPCLYQVAFGDKAGAQRTVPRDSESRTSTVYDRRTGRVAATRTFPAIVKPCPKETESGTSLDASYDHDAYEAWLKTLVKKHRPDDDENPVPPPSDAPTESVVGAVSDLKIPSVDDVRKRFNKLGNKEDKDDVHRDKDLGDDSIVINGKHGADQVMVIAYDLGSAQPKDEPKPMTKLTATQAVKVGLVSEAKNEFSHKAAFELATSKTWPNPKALDDAFKAAGYKGANTLPEQHAGLDVWIRLAYEKDGDNLNVTVYDYSKPEDGAVVAASGTRILYVRMPTRDAASELLKALTAP